MVGCSFDEKQLLAAPLLPEPPAPLGLQDLRVNIVPQVTAAITHRGSAGRCESGWPHHPALCRSPARAL